MCINKCVYVCDICISHSGPMPYRLLFHSIFSYINNH